MEKLKQFIKTNQSAVILAVVILILVAGWFYWYEWRPSQIRKECYKEREEFQLKELDLGIADGNYENDYSIYDDCLLENGLEK